MSLARRLGRLERIGGRSKRLDGWTGHGGEDATAMRAFQILQLWDDLRRAEHGLPPAPSRTWPPTTEEALRLIHDAYRESRDGDSRQLTELIARRDWPPDAPES